MLGNFMLVREDTNQGEVFSNNIIMVNPALFVFPPALVRVSTSALVRVFTNQLPLMATITIFQPLDSLKM
jgi:hypothetical protein